MCWRMVMVMVMCGPNGERNAKKCSSEKSLNKINLVTLRPSDGTCQRSRGDKISPFTDADNYMEMHLVDFFLVAVWGIYLFLTTLLHASGETAWFARLALMSVKRRDEIKRKCVGWIVWWAPSNELYSTRDMPSAENRKRLRIHCSIKSVCGAVERCAMFGG